MTVPRARNRLITAALRLAAAERGGLDDSNIKAEIDNATDIFDEAVHRYVETCTAE